VVSEAKNKEERDVLPFRNIIEELLSTTHLDLLLACPILMSLIYISSQPKTHLQVVIVQTSQIPYTGYVEKCTSQPGLYFQVETLAFLLIQK